MVLRWATRSQLGAQGETVTITAVGTAVPPARAWTLPALAQAHANGDAVLAPGTGLDLAAPLKFNHAANVPFSDRGTGISFAPATAYAHVSNEPVQALGSGITLDGPLAREHAIDAAVRDTKVTTAGYQGASDPTSHSEVRPLAPSAGNMVLRDAAGLVVDSLNYGLLVDPWAAEGYQVTGGAGQSGCSPAWLRPGPPAGARAASRMATIQTATVPIS